MPISSRPGIIMLDQITDQVFAAPAGISTIATLTNLIVTADQVLEWRFTVDQAGQPARDTVARISLTDGVTTVDVTDWSLGIVAEGAQSFLDFRGTLYIDDNGVGGLFFVGGSSLISTPVAGTGFSLGGNNLADTVPPLSPLSLRLQFDLSGGGVNGFVSAFVSRSNTA